MVALFALTTTLYPTMKTRLEYDPTQFSERVNLLIMLKAEQWKCAPSEALSRLLDELALRELSPVA